jgi:large subunit ribosomal protein L10
MPITRAKKEEMIGKLKEKLNSAAFIALVNFRGLSVSKATELRKSLRANEAEYVVGKKTLLGIAAKETGLEFDKKNAEGEMAIVFSKGEATVTSKTVADFIKKNKNMMKILGGWFEKKWVDENVVKSLAAIPPKEVLLTQLLYVINAPARNLVGVLAAPMRDLVSVLGKIKK